MNDHDDLDGTLHAWFKDEARHDAPRHLFEAVVADTRTRRPRLGWLAMLRGDALETPLPNVGRAGRLLILIVVTGALLVGLLAGALLSGGSAPRLSSVVPSPSETVTPTVNPSETQGATARAPLTVSGGSLPTVEIPPGLQPNLSPGTVEQQVLAEIARDEQTLGQVLMPAKVSLIRLMPPGSTYSDIAADGTDTGGGFTAETLTWAVAAEGTFLSCGSHCTAWTGSTTFIADDGSGGGGGINSGTWIPIPDPSFLDFLAAQGQVFHTEKVPTTGVVTAKSVMDAISGTAFPVADADVASNPYYGSATCADPSKGCQALGPGGSDHAVPIWWIAGMNPEAGTHIENVYGLSTQASASSLAWVAVDATTGKPIASLSMASPSPYLSAVAIEDTGTAGLISGVTYTSNRFEPRVSFRLTAFGAKRISGQETDWCSPRDSDSPTPETSARSIVLGFKMGCVGDLRVIRPYAVDCGTAGAHPDAAELSAAILADPGMGYVQDLGTLEDSKFGKVPKDLFVGTYQARIVEVYGSRPFDAGATDPDHCRLLPEPGSADPAIELRGDMSALLILLDVHGELLVLRVADGGYDAPTGAAAQARGYGGTDAFTGMLSMIYEIQLRLPGVERQ